MPSECHLFYSAKDTMKVKGMLEFQPGVDIQIIQANLFSLSELDRVLESGFLCRRQAILGLLDEPTNLRCSKSDNVCDNCRQIFVPALRPVFDQVHAVLKFLQTSRVDLQTLREFLAGTNFGGSRDDSEWHSLLQTWPFGEIAQFTDFLLSNGLVHKQGYIVNDSPVCYLQPSPKGWELLASGTGVFFPVVPSPVINVFNKKKEWRKDRTRLHDFDKRRFLPKQQKKSN